MGKTASLANIGTIADSSLGFRNRLINGDMRIDQRNAGAAVTIATTVAAYTLDRWGFYSAGATQTVQQVSASSAGYQYGAQVTGATSANTATFYTRLESKNVWDLASKTITLSFSVYNSESSKTLTVLLDYANSVDNFGAVTNFSSTALTISTGWSTQTITATANANVINGLQIQFQFGAVANAATRIITGVQLEKGSTATSFDYRPYGTELALCQRYAIQVVNGESTQQSVALGQGQSATAANYYYQASVAMRTGPALTYSALGDFLNDDGVGGSTPTSLTIARSTTLSCTLVGGGLTTVAGRAAHLRANNSSARLLLSAEL